MLAMPVALEVPLRMDQDGTIRVSDTRVTLDTLIGFYRQGESPEALHDGFPTVPLADIYAVIAYYLTHEDEVNDYLKQRDESAEHIRQEWGAGQTSATKAELLARLENKGRTK